MNRGIQVNERNNKEWEKEEKCIQMQYIIYRFYWEKVEKISEIR